MKPVVVEGDKIFHMEQLLESFRNKKAEVFSAKKWKPHRQQIKSPQHRQTQRIRHTDFGHTNKYTHSTVIPGRIFIYSLPQK